VLQTLQSEHDHLVSQVDTVRDTAIEIIAHSNRYSKTVEPLLTLLNQRWQEVTNRLKVPSSSFSLFPLSPPDANVVRYDTFAFCSTFWNYRTG